MMVYTFFLYLYNLFVKTQLPRTPYVRSRMEGVPTTTSIDFGSIWIQRAKMLVQGLRSALRVKV